MTAPVRVGVIGLGEVGQHHVKGLMNGASAVLAAVADISESIRARTAEATGARAYASDTELLDDANVEAVVICVPHKFHAGIALRALAKGKHVLVEKPMAVSVAECDAMVAAAKAAGKLLGVSHNQLSTRPTSGCAIRSRPGPSSAPASSVCAWRSAASWAAGGPIRT